jgi:DNA-nicking Smr family endonuclease
MNWIPTLPDRDNDKQAPTTPLPDDDVELFRRRMSDARPLNRDDAAPPPRRSTPRARFKRRDEREVLRESLNADVESMESDNGESLSFLRPTVRRRTFRKLARGNFSVQSEIDLHGLTAAEAKTALADFVERSIGRGHLCVRIIHRKGLGSGQRGPILKRKVDVWLRQWDPVLAFVSARQVDGGTGAIYVLLKKN